MDTVRLILSLQLDLCDIEYKQKYSLFMVYYSINFDVGHEGLGASILKRQLFCGLLIAVTLEEEGWRRKRREEGRVVVKEPHF